MYKVGQNVVHLSHGVGIVKGIEEREFSPNKVAKFYILEIQDNGAPKKVFVPFDGADRLRPIIKESDVKKVYKFLESKEISIESDTWNRRYRAYMEKIHSGIIMNIADVFKSLILLESLSFGERKLLEHAKTLLVKELSMASGDSELQVEDKLESIFQMEIKK